MRIDAAKNWKIVFLVVCVALSLLLVATKGLSFGIDFMGGTELKMELEAGGEAVIDPVVDILKNRLNGMGLKSTQVLKEADNRHISIKISSTDAADIANVKDIINQQAVFEQFVEGEICARGDEISLDISQQGGAFISGARWQVYVKNSGEAPARCGKVMEGKSGHMTDIFLDRPDNAFLLLDSATCTEMSNTQFSSHAQDSGYTVLSFLEDRALIPVVCFDAAVASDEVNESLLADLGLEVENATAVNDTDMDLSQAVSEMSRLNSDGKTTVLLMVNATRLPQELQDRIASLNLTFKVYPKAAGDAYYIDNDPSSWVPALTGLKSTLSIGEGLTNGNPVYSSVFEGGSNTNEEARQTAAQFKIWLTSGNLPVKTKIVLERPNLPELGQQFLKYAGLMALIAVVMVSLIIALRYRHLSLSLFICVTSFSEIIIILGFASLSSWELDMAAIAGIIAAIGTGVDHQVVITDETIRGERKKEDKGNVFDLQKSIDRAFFIIFVSAATAVCAMLPLMSIIDLRGFAFTSIVGVFIGIFITRPAYARIIEIIMK